MKRQAGSRPNRPPDQSGPYGRAWRIAKGDDPNAHLNPITYLIEAPGQSPAWTYYMLGAMDLAGPAADGRPANKDYPDARWEIWVYALNPKGEPYDPDAFKPRFLLPQNVRVQLPDHPVDKVIAVTEKALEAALAGSLPLEPPFSPGSTWHLWRIAIESTLEHPYHHHHNNIDHDTGDI